jgi:hypothetical protein
MAKGKPISIKTKSSLRELLKRLSAGKKSAKKGAKGKKGRSRGGGKKKKKATKRCATKGKYKKSGKSYKRGDVEGEMFIAPKLSASARKEKARKVLPLLRVLQDFKPKSRRSILLSHLDDESCEALYEAVANVMLSDRIHPTVRAKLKRILNRNREPLTILSDKEADPALKKRHLTQMGGGVLSLILSTAIPLLIDLLRPKSK